MPNSANLNFIERIKIQQEREPTEKGPLIPKRTRVQIKIGQVTPKYSRSFWQSFYTATDSVKLSEPKATKFFQQCRGA